jgi:hypothetical protein
MRLCEQRMRKRGREGGREGGMERERDGVREGGGEREGALEWSEGGSGGTSEREQNSHLTKRAVPKCDQNSCLTLIRHIYLP